MDKVQVAEHFSNQADTWVQTSHEGFANHYPTADHRKRVVQRLFKQWDAPLKVLDLGCGGGHLALALAEDGHDVLGIDQSPRMIEIANSSRQTASKDVRNRLRFVEGDIEDAGVSPHSFDVVTAMGVIGYFPNDKAIFRIVDGALKPNGSFIVSSRNRLFNLVSLSHRTKREINTDAAKDLIDEIASYQQEVSAEITQKMATSLSEKAAFISNQATLPPAAASLPPLDEAATMQSEARQHTPQELSESAQKNGFMTSSLHGIHPHLINPAANQFLPAGVYNTLSTCLEALEDEPISLTWSSVFIAALKKTS